MDLYKDMNQVRERLYIGNMTAAKDCEHLLQVGISHIVTIDVAPLKLKEYTGRFKVLFIESRDDSSADLLSHFEECFRFIDTAVQHPQNKVLIHCVAGCSHSATVMIAYLMYSEKLSLEEAYSAVKEHRPVIQPNSGFLDQLELFESMGRKVDKFHPAYRKFRLSLISTAAKYSNIVMRDEDFASPTPTDKSETYYKCAKCRQALFRESSIMSHTVGESESAFDWRSKIPANQKPVDCATNADNKEICDKSIFIEPVQWMAESIKQHEGKLNCPKCNAKLGSFVWYGEPCPCGSWVVPAFHIQRSKVDEVKPRPLPTFSQSNESSVNKNSSSGLNEQSIKHSQTVSLNDFKVLETADGLN